MAEGVNQAKAATTKGSPMNTISTTDKTPQTCEEGHMVDVMI